MTASPKSRLVKRPPSTKVIPSMIVGAKAPGIEAEAVTDTAILSTGTVSSKTIILPVFRSTDCKATFLLKVLPSRNPVIYLSKGDESRKLYFQRPAAILT